jgi:hypothetical protein
LPTGTSSVEGESFAFQEPDCTIPSSWGVYAPDPASLTTGCQAYVTEVTGIYGQPFWVNLGWVNPGLNESQCLTAYMYAELYSYITPPGGPGGTRDPFWYQSGWIAGTGQWSNDSCQLVAVDSGGVLFSDGTDDQYTYEVRVLVAGWYFQQQVGVGDAAALDVLGQIQSLQSAKICVH